MPELTPPHRHGSTVTTLPAAHTEFWRSRAPRILVAGVVLAVLARVALGRIPSWRDVVAMAAVVAIFPFGEWFIHVYLLHLAPLRWRGRRIELVTAAAHRKHHELILT